MNRLSYDACAYNKALGESVAPLEYVLDPVRYEHCHRCRVDLGVVGGTAVSHISGSLVDLENNLLGIDRPNTHCPAYKHAPSATNTVQGREYVKPVLHPAVDTTPVHLPACQMHGFPGAPLPPAPAPYRCG
jgi:hypothetical protein